MYPTDVAQPTVQTICGKWLVITKEIDHTALLGEQTAKTSPHNSLFHSVGHVPRYYHAIYYEEQL